MFFTNHNLSYEHKEGGIGWHVGYMREKINAYVVFVLKPDGKKPI